MIHKPSRPPTPSILAALLALLALVAAGCQGSDPEPPAATLDEPTTEPPPDLTPSDSPTPTPTLDPTLYAIPDNPEDLNAEYFERVLQALYSLEAEAVRRILREGELSEDAESILRSVYHPEQQEFRMNLYEQEIEEGFPGTKRPPGDLVITVDEVISADAACVFLSGFRDFREVEQESRNRGNEQDFFQLLLKSVNQDPEDRNPTPWVIGGSVVREDGSQPDDPCGR